MKITEKTIITKVFQSLDSKDIDLDNACQLKIYAILKTALELNIPKDMVENTVENYRRGLIKL